MSEEANSQPAGGNGSHGIREMEALKLRDQAVRLGFLDGEKADAALDQYRKTKTGRGFADFLRESGLLSRDGLERLEPMEETTREDAPDGEPDPNIGVSLSGAVVVRKLGEGGMSTVYLARREGSGEEVVIKLLAPELAANRAWRIRFSREARLMERLSHPGFVKLYSVAMEGKEPHIVMEYVRGESLDSSLEKRHFPPLEGARIARGVAQALAQAHREGIIHRDLKPSNVVITPGGETKILDLGLAKSIQQVDEGLSVPGLVLGTPYFMAPEQWGDHDVDARCDIYSLGATLYAMVTGTVPFKGSTYHEISTSVLSGKFPPPRSVVPEIPAELEIAIFQMMACDRRFRYQCMERCAEDLERIIEGKALDAPRLEEKPRQKCHILLPGIRFDLGRDTGCDIILGDRSVSRRHARIERGAAGFVLGDLKSTSGTFVGGMRIHKEVALKEGDEIALGKAVLTFHAGNLGKLAAGPLHVSPAAKPVRAIPVPLVNALIERTDRRIVLALIEELAPDAQAAPIRDAVRRLVPIIGQTAAEAVGKRLEGDFRRWRAGLPAQLFAITRENLGENVEAWLSWWDEDSQDYPAQIVPELPRPAARLRIVRGEPEPRTILLEGKAATTIGRDPRSDVPLNTKTVSRIHATILRPHRRALIRDEGSRLGTAVNGSKVQIGFLGHGDRIVLGTAEMVFEIVEPAAPGGRAVPILPEAFFVLEEVKSPAIASALARFLELAAEPEWIEVEAARLFEDPKRAADLARQVRGIYGHHAGKARELLPGFLGGTESSPASWRELLERKLPELPSQVEPAGWFPSRAEPPSRLSPDAETWC